MHVRSLRWMVAVVLLVSPIAFAQQSASIASQIALLNRSLETGPQLARPSRGVTVPTLLNVLQVRQKLVEQLIETDPGLVRSVMLPSATAEELRSASPEYATAIETDTNWSGTLSATVADDFEHGTSTTHWYLQSGDRRIELFFVGNQDPMQHIHRSVSVRGVATTRVMSVEGLHPDLTAPTNTAGQNCTSIGVENTAVLVMEQPSGGTAYPPISFFDNRNAWPWPQDYFGSTVPSANNYWQEASFGLTSGTGTVFGPLTFVSNHTCSDTDAMEADAIAVAKANSIDFSAFSRVSIIFPVQSCVFGGLGSIGCNSPVVDSNLDHPFSVTWIPVRTDYTTTFPVRWGVIAHELGHNLGLNHSSSLQFGTTPLGAIDYVDNNGAGGTGSSGVGARVEYGDPYTIMGNGSYNCFGQYTAFNKSEYLAWMNRTSDVNEVTGSGSFKIVPFENSSGLRALRILRDPLTSSWLWMEYRQALGHYDNDFGTCLGTTDVLSGANVYYESPYSQDGHLFLLDMNVSGSTGFDIDNGALTPGHSWSDPYSPLTLSVTSADSTGINVTASYDQPCATLSTPSVFPAAGGSGSITVTVTSTPCQWSASTIDSWITNVSPSSGTTSGTVNFTVASNTASTSQRNGYVTVQRQSVPVAQKGTATFIANMSPALQSGLSGTLGLTFNDPAPAGAPDIGSVELKIHGSDCDIYMGQSSNQWYMFLLDPASNNFSSAVYFGTPNTTLSTTSAQCSINAATTSASINGSQLQLNLALTFAQAFQGSYRVTTSACDGTGCSQFLPVGTWQVAAGPVPSISGLSATAGKQGTSVPITIIGANTHFGGTSTLSVSGSGVASSGISTPSSTQLKATLTIDPNATASTRTLTVTTGSEVVTSSFTVNASGQDAVAVLSRPSRPTVPPSASTHTGIISHAIFTLGDFGVTSASDLVCQGSRRLTCTVEPAESGDRFRIAIDATLARPGRYVLHVVAPSVPNAKAIAVPVLVKSSAKPGLSER